MNELEKATIFLTKMAKEYKVYGDLDNPEFENSRKNAEAIETVLKALEKLKDDNYKLDRENQLVYESNENLRSYLAKNGLISDYIRFKRRGT